MHKYAVATAMDSVVAGADSNRSHFLGIEPLEPSEFASLLSLAGSLRNRPRAGAGLLEGKTVVLALEKPSLRTRVTFEVAVHQLGGRPLMLGPAESRLGEREPIEDLARNLSLWVDGIVARVFRHSDLERLAEYSRVPVINALSDREHPCQALADILTLRDLWGDFRDRTVVYVGDWNNVSRSLALACDRSGLRFRAVGPVGYGPAPEENVDWTSDLSGVRSADAVYTDVWTSMGSEDDLAARRDVFAPYQVNRALLDRTGKDSVFMHCLPAQRGLEVSHDVIESPRSLVFTQAANRLPAEKAVLISLMEERP